MTRTIKASEVKPGMEVEITTVRRMTVNNNYAWGDSHRTLSGDNGHIARLSVDAPVTVVSESQPEEPTSFGARVMVKGRRFVRAYTDSSPWVDQEEWDWWTWDDLCEMGPVTVVPDQGWGVPGNAEPAPEVPDQIEEWPEDDTHLREYRWRDMYGDVWVYVDGVWRWNTHPYGDYKTPVGGPWFLTTATHTNKENA